MALTASEFLNGCIRFSRWSTAASMCLPAGGGSCMSHVPSSERNSFPSQTLPPNHSPQILLYYNHLCITLPMKDLFCCLDISLWLCNTNSLGTVRLFLSHIVITHYALRFSFTVSSTLIVCLFSVVCLPTETSWSLLFAYSSQSTLS